MKMSKHGFSVRSYREGDELKINEMFNEVFSENRDITHWYWKYRDNPSGAHAISLAESEDGVLAAHYGGYPVFFYSNLNGRERPDEFMSFQLGDKMTRKKFRGVGFGKTSLLALTFFHFQDSFASHIPFGYGFGTHHSLKFGLKFLSYADIEPVPFRTMKIGMPVKMWGSRLKDTLKRVRVSEVTEIDDEWTDFFYRVAPSYRYLVRRDAPYLRWRYLSRPDRKYLILKVITGRRLSGWSVFYRKDNKIIWGDALFDRRDLYAAEAIFRSLREHPAAEGAESIECWFPGRPAWWDEKLLRIGFETAPEPNDLHLTGPVFNDPNAPEKIRKHLYYSLGDSDLF